MRVRRLVVLVAIAGCNARAEPDIGASSRGPNPNLTIEERRLLVAATIALPPAGLAPESLPEAGSRGALLLTAHCVQCHAMPWPTMHASQDWPSVARRMWVRIDMMRGELGVVSPSEGERVQLLNYLLAHSLQVADQLPAGPGREVFSATCSRCHSLPDPRTHSPADWPAVVMRMERNMERMKLGGVTSDQAQRIVTYLETASRR